ncbi:MAG: hypothetical protein B0D91_01480 [Oceanospirillales bacterium LUC14_002_19_P2]|nr:MAG: hypothetical protein B0D91_01480 [Oceanospirillales bacterium LUC14_002_19_P2]
MIRLRHKNPRSSVVPWRIISVLLTGCDKSPDMGVACPASLPSMVVNQQTGSAEHTRDSNRSYRQLSWAYYLDNSEATPLFDPPLDVIPGSLSVAESHSINTHIIPIVFSKS